MSLFVPSCETTQFQSEFSFSSLTSVILNLLKFHSKDIFKCGNIFTARFRRMGEGNIFSLSTLAGRGVPRPRSMGGGYPIPGTQGTSHHHQDWMGYPHPPIRQSSITSTCYVAGGVPLAFTQEDFLVLQEVLIYITLSENNAS